jgi:hypothetical protein
MKIKINQTTVILLLLAATLIELFSNILEILFFWGKVNYLFIIIILIFLIIGLGLGIAIMLLKDKMGQRNLMISVYGLFIFTVIGILVNSCQNTLMVFGK